AAVGGVLLLLLALLHFVEPGAEDLEGALLVLALRTTVLAADHDAGGQVEDLHGGLGAVDVLAAGAARPAYLDAQIVGPDLDIDLLGLGHHGDRHRRGVDPALRLGGRDALDTVYARLVLENAENLVAGHAEEHFLEAADFGGTAGEVLRFPPPGLGVALVGAQQFGGEK